MKKKLLSALLALVLCLGLTAPVLAAGEKPTFTDVPAGHWAYEAIENMAGQAVVDGVSPGKFAPDDKVACADFSTMLARLLFAEALEQHTDKTYWWKPYADTLLEAGVLDNTTAKAFYIRAMYQWDKVVMEQPMSRYDMAQIMYNALKAKDFTLPSGHEMELVREEIGDYADVPREYADAVAAMYALGCLQGMDQAHNFRGGEKMDRAQACTVLVRLQNALNAQPEQDPAPSAAPVATPSPAPSASPEPTATPEPTPEPTPAPTPAPVPAAGPEADLVSMRLEMLAMINEFRAQEGLSPLRLNEQLCRAAQIRAEELVQRIDATHKRPDGRDCVTVLSEVGITYQVYGENIAAGQTSVKEVMTSWMNSPGHRANILESRFGQIGIGLYYTPNGGYRYYWSQEFLD